MSKIIEMIDDFRMNQEIMGRKPRYVDVCMYRLKMFRDYIETLEVYEVEGVKPIHVKKFIKERQNLGKECNRTIGFQSIDKFSYINTQKIKVYLNFS